MGGFFSETEEVLRNSLFTPKSYMEVISDLLLRPQLLCGGWIVEILADGVPSQITGSISVKIR